MGAIRGIRNSSDNLRITKLILTLATTTTYEGQSGQRRSSTSLPKFCFVARHCSSSVKVSAELSTGAPLLRLNARRCLYLPPVSPRPRAARAVSDSKNVRVMDGALCAHCVPSPRQTCRTCWTMLAAAMECCGLLLVESRYCCLMTTKPSPMGLFCKGP